MRSIKANSIGAKSKLIGCLLLLCVVSKPSFSLAQLQASQPGYTQFAYVYNVGENTVTPYGVNAIGALEFLPLLSPIKTGMAPGGFSATPSGKYVYLVNWASNDISMYATAPDGNLLPLAPPVTSGGVNPFAITVTPSGKYAYVTNSASNNIAMFRIDSATGVLKPLKTDKHPNGIINLGAKYMRPASFGIEPNGNFAYVVNMDSNNIATFNYDDTTGDLDLQPDAVAAGMTPRRITFDKAGHAYVVNQGDEKISAYTINQANGSLTLIQSVDGPGFNPIFMTVHPSGKYAYVTNMGSNDIAMYAIESSGALHALNPSLMNTDFEPRNIYISIINNNSFVYAVNQGSNTITMYKIDMNTGQLTYQAIKSIKTGFMPEGMTFPAPIQTLK